MDTSHKRGKQRKLYKNVDLGMHQGPTQAARHVAAICREAAVLEARHSLLTIATPSPYFPDRIPGLIPIKA